MRKEVAMSDDREEPCESLSLCGAMEKVCVNKHTALTIRVMVEGRSSCIKYTMDTTKFEHKRPAENMLALRS